MILNQTEFNRIQIIVRVEMRAQIYYRIISLIINIQLIITNSKDYCLIIHIQLIITNSKDYCLIIYNLITNVLLIITDNNDY